MRHLYVMAKTTHMSDLSGKLLVAMPGLGDPRFEKSVLLICAHSEQGSMGLIVNKPASEITFDALLKQLSIPALGGSCPIHVGGPMEGARGFVLHSPQIEAEDGTMDVGDDFAMTTTPDILRDIACGAGPGMALLALGYAGWAPGQLESEILRDDWLVASATPELVFSPDNGAKWGQAIRSMGFDPVSLSAIGGRA